MQDTFYLSETFWLYLDRFGILLGDLVMTMTLIGGIYGFFYRNTLRRWLIRNSFPTIGEIPPQNAWQGLIFTVSQSELPQWVIRQVQPTCIGLLYTRDTQALADQIRASSEIKQIRVCEGLINDADDPVEVKRKTLELLEMIKQDEVSDIAVDITGGKKTMSLGAFMAAEESGIATIYVTTVYRDNKPESNATRIKILSGVRL